MRYLPQILKGDLDIDPEKLLDQAQYDCADSPKDALSMELESWVDAIISDKTPVVDGKAGTKALEVAHRIIKIINEQVKKNKLKV